MLNPEEQTNLQKLSDKLEVSFKNINLLKESLTHRSYLNDHRNMSLENNERLEFLGDAVLELVVTEELFQRYPDKAEGQLTSFRAALVRRESLAETAADIGLGAFLYLSRGEDATGGRERAYILANALEAVIGAVYLDQGYKSAHQIIHTYLLPKLDKIVAERSDIDAKSQLQELVQEHIKVTPVYVTLSETGPDHSKKFNMGLHIGDILVAEGEGHSKQEGEQVAAKVALQNWTQIYQKLQSSGKIRQ